MRKIAVQRRGGFRRAGTGRTLAKWLAGGLAALLFGSAAAVSGSAVVPAIAAEGASLLLVKTVDGQDAKRDLRPGDSVSYRVEFRVNDEDADSPVTVVDQLPAEFAGWEISELTALLGGSPANVALDMPGIASGPAGSVPLSGTIGGSQAERAITVTVSEPVQAGEGNTAGTGISTRYTGVLEYVVTVPEGLSPNDPVLRKDLVNTATFSAKSGAQDLSTTDSAVISVDNPIAADVIPAKSWSPESQSFQPGAVSTIVIGATQASNVPASVLSLQDPASDALAPDGATSLPAENPFAYVDFAGFDGDPTSNLPAGATSAAVEVYHFDGASWNWTAWDAAMATDTIAGVRIAYSGEILPGASVSQAFNVQQRETNRASGASISAGYDISNDVRATVEVPGLPPVSKNAEAPFSVGSEKIDVTAEKLFRALPDGAPTANLTGVVAGDSVGVLLRASNRNAPHSTTLDALSVEEPSEGSNARFFGEELRFGGFDTIVWPNGATAATIDWSYTDGTEESASFANGSVPAPAAGKTVKSFKIDFTGAITPDTSAEIGYRLDSTVDEAFVPAGGNSGPQRNTIRVTGERDGLPQDVADAAATVNYVSPKIETSIDKRVGPGVVLPGQSVIVQLDTEVRADDGGRTRPTEIVVEDAWSGEDTFWDAFEATEIIAPINRPENSDLRIFVRDAAGEWSATPFATNPSETENLAVPQGSTGLRFVYTKDDGFSQITYVKPNIEFRALSEKRSGGATSGEDFDSVTVYENEAGVTAEGRLGTRTVVGTDTDTENVGVRGTGSNGTGPNPGTGVWTDKDWTQSVLPSQTNALGTTTQRWAVTEPGLVTVQLQDPAEPTATGVGTVFEAFDLRRILPIAFSSDPMLEWDVVEEVELFDGVEWAPVAKPDGSWMNATGFKGYTLTEAQRQSTLGVRLVLGENTDARNAAAEAGDLTAPAAGSGVSASGDIREFRLQWQLRNTARVAPGDPVKIVKEKDTLFNCVGESVTGCVDNVFRLIGFPESGDPVSSTSNDTVQIIDTALNVGLTKQVQAIDPTTGAPAGPIGMSDGGTIGMIVPNVDELTGQPEVDAADYPRARFTLSARNTSTSGVPGVAGGNLAKLRVVDTANPDQPVAGSASQFEGRDFVKEATDPDYTGTRHNHFNEFTLTGVSIQHRAPGGELADGIPSFIDPDESTVEVWLYEPGGDPAGTSEWFTLRQVLDQAPEFTALLPNVVGVSTVFSGTDPTTNGNRIPVGHDLIVNLDAQLRTHERALPEQPVKGSGNLTSVERVDNSAIARGIESVLDDDVSAEPTARADVGVNLQQATVRTQLEKSVSVAHADGSHDDVITETEQQAPVNVLLTASDNGSTAPLDDLMISDETDSFWDRFEFVSFGSGLQYPSDSDRAAFQVKVGDSWLDFAGYTGDPADIRGVRVVYDRADGARFPLGAASWSASYGSATLPFTVQLREDAIVDWVDGDEQENTGEVVARNSSFGSARDTADAEVTFSPGVHQLRVEKRAPNDTGTHQVSPLASLPWQLVFTNTGSSYLPIERVTDSLPAALSWDGEPPVFTSTPGPNGGELSSNADDIEVSLSPDGRSLEFVWPAGARMAPGETMTIELGLIMQPLPAGERATNEVVVTTGLPLALCTQPTEFGQAPNPPAADDQCSNTNYVQPRVGTVIGAVKTVNGEPYETLGEDLVSGALNVRTGDECQPASHLPIGSDYTRNPCASYTAVGAIDKWKLEHINSGTNPMSRVTLVDMLPIPGDRMLAGGASRTSTFRPVLVGSSVNDIFTVSGLPEGAEYTIEVTTNPDACVGSTSGASLWVDDPSCSDAATNPANVWTPLSGYAGALEDIAGIRVDVVMAEGAPLEPAGNIVLEFETVNRVVDTAAEGLQPTLEQFQTPQFAWNQNGVIAWDTQGNRVNLPAAPQRAGVTVKTGELVISKDVLGEGAQFAPEEFPVDISCTVPSGVESPARVALDLGDSATVMVPKDDTVTLAGLPIGADCEIREAGEVGAHGESGRSIEDTEGVEPSTDGLSATVKIRESESGAARVSLHNTYTLGGFVVEKAVVSGNEHELEGEPLDTEFGFELVCEAKGSGEQIRDAFTLKAGEQHEVTGLPEGAECVLTEADTGEARSTSITIGGEETEGGVREGIVVTAEGGHALVTNVFDGVPPEKPGKPGTPKTPEKLGKTGGEAPLAPMAVLALLLTGAVALLAARRRRTEAAE